VIFIVAVATKSAVTGADDNDDHNGKEHGAGEQFHRIYILAWYTGLDLSGLISSTNNTT
jgi:hypothetical protein